ncbi:unnamed protein product, partial [Cladocopium goreaui]
SCCRGHKHSCSELRLHVAAWSVPEYHQELDVEVASGLAGTPRCLGDDLYRDYFEDVRRHAHGLQGGILGSRTEKLVANLAPSLMSSCPEVSLLGRLVVVERICQSLLQNPLSPEALDRQQILRQDVQDIVPNLEANLHVGYLTLVPMRIVTELLRGACGKMIQAEHEAPENMHGVGEPGSEVILEVLEPNYRWPSPQLAGKSLKEQGIHCHEGEKLMVGEALQDGLGFDPQILFFADLNHPMPHDGLLSNLQFPFVTENQVQEVRLDIILLRPLVGTDNRWSRRGTLVFVGQALGEELHVWRGDVLAFAGTGARMLYRNCSERCRVASLPMLQSSHFQEVHRQNTLELGATLFREYSWSAELIPTRCRASSWSAPHAPLPPLHRRAAPRRSMAHCSGRSWGQRSCRFQNLCYDVARETFEFYGNPSNSDDYLVGLSMFSDVRMSWKPDVLEASDSKSASWVDVPVYLAMRHLEELQKWTTLGLYALIMSNEDLREVHGQRLVFFLDECSLELQGDAIEFCMQFVPNPTMCIKEIPELCAKFTEQLWPLLSDWAPLEKAQVAERAPSTRILCFRSLVAGMAPWRRPVQVEDSQGMPLAQQEWAADPLFAPVSLVASKGLPGGLPSPGHDPLMASPCLPNEVIRQFQAGSIVLSCPLL